ncbi:tRNA preQ1(34) S-adenosylmethionine ribosyltransferase-isomerase QueA [Patescibacteria group bacterium]|nr:tRNA preQ1(34) S-adenosylmethionine ribosyltransferase-isomerase QueA [Patescibacteria group bacterium]
MDTSVFDYDLPASHIAQHSVEPRDHARMLCMDRTTGALEDKHVLDLPSFLRPTDLLVFNDSKVFKARFVAEKLSTGAKLEIFFLRSTNEVSWIVLAKPAKRLSMGDRLRLAGGWEALVVNKHEDGTITLVLPQGIDAFFAYSDEFGEIPTPPYVQADEHVQQSYQTVYAKNTGSVAAPTAGFHFTERLLKELDAKGVRRAFVTLHVGLGTFRPMKDGTLEEHVMHQEWGHVSQETMEAIKQTKARGGRVIAVGTTAVRALESAARTGLSEWSGNTSLFITPGYSFRVIDGLITNFHLPKSTLIVLVSTFAGTEHVKHAYQHAIEQNYRFYSFGDAMCILSSQETTKTI